MGEIDVLAELSDMKLIDYKNTLALVSLIEVLTEKGVIESNEIAVKAKNLDYAMENQIKSKIV